MRRPRFTQGCSAERKEGRMCVYVYVSFRLRPYCDSGGHSMASHRGAPRSNPPQPMWDLRWTKWHWDMFFSEQFDCPCRYHSTHDHLNATLIRRTSGRRLQLERCYFLQLGLCSYNSVPSDSKCQFAAVLNLAPHL